jgi:hypothetical protein
MRPNGATLEEYHALLSFREYQDMEIGYRSGGIARALAGGGSAVRPDDGDHTE